MHKGTIKTLKKTNLEKGFVRKLIWQGYVEQSLNSYKILLQIPALLINAVGVGLEWLSTGVQIVATFLLEGINAIPTIKITKREDREKAISAIREYYNTKN